MTPAKRGGGPVVAGTAPETAAAATPRAVRDEGTARTPDSIPARRPGPRLRYARRHTAARNAGASPEVLDDVYVSASHIRTDDPEVVRLRRRNDDQRERHCERWEVAERRRDGLEPDAPATFGLDEHALGRLADDLQAAGWSAWEVETRLADPATAGGAA